jgi:hypothetical protein
MTEVNEFNRRNIEEFRRNHGRLGGPFDGAPVCYCTPPGRAAAKNGCTH